MASPVVSLECVRDVLRRVSLGKASDGERDQLVQRFLFPIARVVVLTFPEVPDHVDYEDLISDVLETLLRKLEKCDPEGSPSAYFQVVARNAVIRSLKKEAKVRAREISIEELFPSRNH